MNTSPVSSAHQFLTDLGARPELRRRLEGAASSQEKLSIIQEEGYTFTRQEWEAVLPKAEAGALSDEALGAVVGGKVIPIKSSDWSEESEKNGWLREFLGKIF